jgi:hypothetical protein
MKIINDTEVFEPGECLFALNEGNDITVIAITSKAFWAKNHHLDDSLGDHSFPEETNTLLTKNSIWNEMESTWFADLALDETRAVMLAAGFVESKEMTETLKHMEDEQV